MSHRRARSLCCMPGPSLAMYVPDVRTGNVAVSFVRAPRPTRGARRFERQARDGALRLALHASGDRSQHSTVARRSRHNGATPTELPTMSGRLETSPQAILTTFTFPAALSGENVSLLGVSCARAGRQRALRCPHACGPSVLVGLSGAHS